MERQFKALSQIMDRNNLTDMREKMMRQNRWYQAKGEI